MKLKDFDYNLPKELIAQKPIRPRDHSRLLVIKRRALSDECSYEHKHFYNLADYLYKGDVLIVNNSKVFPARLIGKRKKTGGKVEVFLLKKIQGKIWQCLVGSPRKREGLVIEFSRGLNCVLVKDNGDGTWEVKFNKRGDEMMKIVEKIGQVPLPPYIKKSRDPIATLQDDRLNYQTVYAEKIGSVAAPTAGFHFTPSLIKKLKAKGVQFEYITLHVGLGTFAPVKIENIKKHKMHAEWVEVKKSVLENLIKAKQEDRRIIAVGTTSVRTLEAIFQKKTYKGFLTPLRSVRNDKKKKIENRKSKIENYKGWVDIFIYPGYKFNIVDAMITNFHLPKSTLLMLVSAFASRVNIDKAYICAIKNKYRFYSYGDAMLIILIL